MTQAFIHLARLTVWSPRPEPAAPLGAFFGALVPNGLVVEDLRIQFTSKKDKRSAPNVCEVTVTNLSAQSRGEFATMPKRAALEFGYASTGHMRQLFSGDVTHVAHERTGTDWLTKVTIADGSRAYRFARVSRSMAAGTTILAAAREAAAALGLEIPAAAAARPEMRRQFANGLVLAGNAAAELTKLLEPIGLSWSIQDGTLAILDEVSVRPGEEILIDEAAGVIGSPVFAAPTKPGKRPRLSATCLLYPEIAPGRRVRLRTRAVSGSFRVESVSHEGSNWSDAVATSFEAIPL